METETSQPNAEIKPEEKNVTSTKTDVVDISMVNYLHAIN